MISFQRTKEKVRSFGLTLIYVLAGFLILVTFALTLSSMHVIKPTKFKAMSANSYGSSKGFIQNFKKEEDAKKKKLDTHTQKDLRRIFYLHVPKCGSSFATALVQYACPTFPKNLTVREPSLLKFPTNRKMDYQHYCDGRFKRFNSGHEPLPKVATPLFFKENNVVTFVRNATERIISGFLHNFHDCDMKQMAKQYSWLFLVEDSDLIIRDRTIPNYTALFSDVYTDELSIIYSFYWRCVEGCATRMILGDKCGNNFSQESLSPLEILTAIERIQQFDFVGLTEKWKLSMQLWSCMFGGTYSEEIFKNTRPSSQGNWRDNLYQLTRTLELTDEADSILYLYAEAKFNSNIQSTEQKKCHVFDFD